MSAEQLATRILSSKAQVSSHLMRTGKLTNDQFDELAAGVSLLSRIPLYIDDTPGITVQAIKNRARRMKRDKTKGLGLIVIDYLQLITTAGRSENRVQELSEMTRALKIMAKDLNVPVIVLSQLSRSVEQRDNKRPMLSDLRESGSIEQDADIVMFLYRDDYYNPETEKKNIAEVILAKHRSGSTGTVELVWLGQYTKFANIKK